MLGLMSASKLLKERSAERPAMQSNDLSTALSQTHRGRDLAIGGSVVSAALTAGVFVCLPILTPTLASANGPSIMSAIAGGGTVSNAVLKGDRLSNSRSKIEHPDAGAVSSPAAPANVGATPKRHLPIGCESAFGALVRAGNAPARCVTDITLPTRAA
jgi:hypothetical protein